MGRSGEKFIFLFSPPRKLRAISSNTLPSKVSLTLVWIESLNLFSTSPVKSNSSLATALGRRSANLIDPSPMGCSCPTPITLIGMPWIRNSLATSKMGKPRLFLPSEKTTTEPSDCSPLSFRKLFDNASPKAVFFPSSITSHESRFILWTSFEKPRFSTFP